MTLLAPKLARVFPTPIHGSPGRIGYNLRQIPNLHAWFDAMTLVPSIGEGITIASWTDLSGNGNHATQSTSDARPVLRNRIRNERAVVRFDGTDDWLDLPSTGLLTGAFTVVLCGRHRAPDGNFDYLIGSGNTPGFCFIRGNNANTVFGAGNTSVVAGAQTQYKVYSLRHDGAGAGGVTTFVNSVSAGTGTGSAGAALNLCLGSLGDGTVANTFLQGDLAAVAVFGRALTNAELLYVENAMLNTYNRPYIGNEIEQDLPIGWWKLDDTKGGGSAVDSGSLANNGTYAGAPSWTRGISAHLPTGATRFGSPAVQRVTVPDAAGYDTPNFTLELLGSVAVLPTSIGQVFPGLIKSQSGDPVDQPSYSFSLGVGSGAEDKPFFTVFGDLAGNKVSVVANAAVAAGEVFHMLGTYTESGAGTGVVTLYVNGVSQGTPATMGAGRVINPTSGLLNIGGIPGFPEQMYGVWQHAAIYSSALSAARITAHANAAISGT